MNISVHLEIVGALLVMLGVSHAFFNRYFGWERELASVSLLTRRIFFVHTFFIGLGVVLAGAGSFLYAEVRLPLANQSPLVFRGRWQAAEKRNSAACSLFRVSTL